MSFRVYTANGKVFEANSIETANGNLVFTRPDNTIRQIELSEMKAVLFNGYEDFILQQSIEIGDLKLQLEKARNELSAFRKDLSKDIERQR